MAAHMCHERSLDDGEKCGQHSLPCTVKDLSRTDNDLEQVRSAPRKVTMNLNVPIDFNQRFDVERTRNLKVVQLWSTTYSQRIFKVVTR